MSVKTGPNPTEFHSEYSLMPETAERARQLHQPLYFTGRRCLRDHLSPRYTSSSNGVECIEQKQKLAGRNMRAGAKFRTQAENDLAVQALAQGKKTYVGKPCPAGHFERRATTGNCIECEFINNKKRKDRSKWKRIFDLYGLMKNDFERMIADQKNKCSICDASFENVNLHIDHCHSTGKVRSLLCSRCNQAIGLIDESIERADKIKQYLKRHNHAA